MLTDGRRWRLYAADGRVDDYCEVDLEAALEADDRVALEQFVRLFGGDAFREGADGACPLDAASTESEELARERVRTLRTDVCRAVVDLASERSTDGDRAKSVPPSTPTGGTRREVRPRGSGRLSGSTRAIRRPDGYDRW